MKNQAKTNTFMYKLIDLIDAIVYRLTLSRNKITPKKNYDKDFFKPEFHMVLDEIEFPSDFYKQLAYSDYVDRRARKKYRAYESKRDRRYKIAKKARNEAIKEKFLVLFK